jgi:hypothetical protein
MALMQNKGSALAFLVVLLVMCIGACAAFSALTTGKESQVVAVESWTPTGVAMSTPGGSTPMPTDTPADTPSPNSELSTPVVPTATPVPPATATPVASPTPRVSPTSTTPAGGVTPPVPQDGRQYRVLRNERDCTRARLIGGWVYDAGGNGLPWAMVHLYNDYGWSAELQTEGQPQAGKYEFTMGSDAGVFHLVIVDGAGQPLSPVVDIDYQPDCSQRVEWQRVQ